MNSQFQKPSTGSERGGRSSAGDPPSFTGEMPAIQPSFSAGGSGTGPSSDGRDSGRGRPSGSEALLDEAQDAAGSAADSVYAATGAIADASAQLGDVAKEAVRATVNAVSAQAAALSSNIAQELTATAEEQKEQGAEAVRRFAHAIRTAAQELDGDSPEIARRIRGAAGSIDSLSDNLHSKSVGDLFNAAGDFARRQPAAFFAGAVIAGFAFSRFLKSSGQPAAQPDRREEDTAVALSSSAQGVAPSAPSAATF